jgi:hypothetical protein
MYKDTLMQQPLLLSLLRINMDMGTGKNQSEYKRCLSGLLRRNR